VYLQKVRPGLDEGPLNKIDRGYPRLLVYFQKVRTGLDKNPLHERAVQEWIRTQKDVLAKRSMGRRIEITRRFQQVL
jgi:hypothetical protein